MHYGKVMSTGIVALTLAVGACNRDRGESRTADVPDRAAANVDRTAELQRQRADEISRLDKRVADIERKYSEANENVATGKRTATAGLREEVKEDVTNVKEAVNDLRTTTPDNWWERHEVAMRRTEKDVEEDVTRLGGKVTPAPVEHASAAGEHPSDAPFTSRRDRFVADLRARVDAMEKALDNVKTRGAQKTEVDDTRARVKKLGDDVDRLRSASADDWWDVSKARVTEYLDRVENSVNRLDDNRSSS